MNYMVNQGILGKPDVSEHSSYFGTYIDQVDEDNVLDAITKGHQSTMKFFKDLEEKKWEYRYEASKWSIKEMMVHLIDAERVFCFRALAMSRGEKTDLPGFDHLLYVNNSEANDRTAESIIIEYDSVRSSTLTLFSCMSKDQLLRIGTVGSSPASARAIAWIIAGHEAHHMRVIHERYL